MKEQIFGAQGTPEQIKQGEEMMTEEQKTQSQEREYAFLAGEKHAKHKIINSEEKTWDERVIELRLEYPETMKFIEHLPGSCVHCANGSPTEWGDAFNSIIKKETGISAQSSERMIREAKNYKELGGFSADENFYAQSIDSCVSFGEKGVMSILSAILNARKSKKIDW